MRIYVYSSHGHFEIDQQGKVVSHELTTWEEPIPVLFDVAEFIQCYGKLDDSIDILDIGYTNPDGTYIPADQDFRAEAKQYLEEQRLNPAPKELLIQTCRFVLASDLFEGYRDVWNKFFESNPGCRWGNNHRTLMSKGFMQNALDELNKEDETGFVQVRERLNQLADDVFIDLDN